MTTLPKCYDTETVCKEILVGSDPVWLRRMAIQGKIPGAFKIGHEWRFSEDGLKEMMKVVK